MIKRFTELINQSINQSNCMLTHVLFNCPILVGNGAYIYWKVPHTYASKTRCRN